MRLPQAREAIDHYCHRFRGDGLVTGTAGNISVREGNLVAITPSGTDYDKITPELICVVDLSGAWVDCPLKPASELPLHLAAYRGCEQRIGDHAAVVHTHSTAATAVASLQGVTELPNVHYYTAMFGGPLPITEYARFGTDLIAERCEQALVERTGCLLGNHGAVAVGTDLDQAYDKAIQIEWLAELYLRTLAAGTPRLLDQDEIDGVAEAIKSYGQKPPVT